MVNITLKDIGKKFNREWVFRNLNAEIQASDKLVILGGNGSGKSTLLQLVSGYITPNEGTLSYSRAKVAGGAEDEENKIDPEKIKDHLSFASPYIQLIEDFNAPELIAHLRLYKPFMNDHSADQILEISELTHAKNKFIRQYSSGMKQRLKLAVAILADTPVLLLDEPLSNLDKNGGDWYKNMITQYATNRTVIVCSNAISDEYFFCDRQLNVMDHKR